MVKLKVLPNPCSLSTQILPPCNSTTFFVIANVLVIPKLGVSGSAIVVVLSSFLYLIMVFVKVRKVLLPRIPVAFWIKLIVWIILVEFTLRLFAIASINHASELTVLIINSIAIITATIVLYLLDYRIYSVVASIFEKTKKIKN